ncbi:MAG TPA: TonB-dependent receptor [Alphaproteobacteria bacterium]|nr:TonB-dependent receptor [Alphaproteobacteria bacterium]
MSLVTLIVLNDAPAQTAGPENQGSVGLEEIVVTAQKRAENIQNVPMSITAVTGDTLKKLALNDFTDLAALTPGLQLTNVDGRSETATLRGISYNEDTGANPSVDVYWNEVVMTPGSAFRSLFDVSQVEVLRGPQGALRGRTSPGGAITITTHRPDLDQFDGYANQQFSDLGLVHSEGAINIPIVSDTLAVRIAGVYDFNGVNQGKDLTTGKDERSQTRALRESIRWLPTDDLEVNLIHQDLTDRYNAFAELVGGPGLSGGPVISADQRATLAQGPEDLMNRQDLTVLTIKYDVLDNLSLNYIAGYQELIDDILRDQEQTNTIKKYLSFQDVLSKFHLLTQEFRVQSQGNSFWDYMFGVYYDTTRSDTPLSQSQALTGFIPGPPAPPPVPGIIDIDLPATTRDFAFFTAQSFKLTDSDLVQAAIRWGQTNEYKQEHLTVSLPQFHLALPQPDQIPPQDVRNGAHYLTGTFNYTHHFDKDLMAYIAWSHGFRPGNVNVGSANTGVDPSLQEYGNEISDEFEVGAKASVLEHRLNLSGDLFHQKFHGYIGLHPTIDWRPGSSGPATSTIAEGGFNGNADVNGIEAQADALITPDWQVSFGASLADARYDNVLSPCEDYLGTGHPNGPPAGATPRIQGSRQVSYCVLNGPISDAPPLTLTLSTEYDVPVFDFQGFARGLATYTSGYYASDLQSGHDPLLLINLYIGLRDPDGRWEAELFIKNLLDRVNQNYQGQFDASAGNNLYDSGYRFITQNPPREVGVSLRYNFGG